MLSRPYYNEADIRKRQIDTLKIFNDNVVEIKENSEYRVDFSVSGTNMSLEVILSPQFPNEKPVILVHPAINHPWIAENSNMVIGAPGLLNYTVYSDLGRVVQAIIRELTKPQIVIENSTADRVASMSPINIGSVEFPNLNEMTIEELQELAENTDLQDQFLETSPQLIELDQAAEEIMLSIESIAKDNLSKQQTLDDAKTEIINRITTIVQLKNDYEELNKKHMKLSEAFDPHRIRENLQEAASKADEEAEALAEQFLAGLIPVDAFIGQYAEKRASGQSRRTRCERLTYQLEQLDKATF